MQQPDHVRPVCKSQTGTCKHTHTPARSVGTDVGNDESAAACLMMVVVVVAVVVVVVAAVAGVAVAGVGGWRGWR